MRRLPKAVKKVSKKDFVEKFLSHQQRNETATSRETLRSWNDLSSDAPEEFLVRW